MGWRAAQQAAGHQVVDGPGQDMAYVVLHKHPQAKGGAGLLCGPGDSYHVSMGTSMEPPVKLLVLIL